MTMGHYLRSMKQLTNQWTPTNFRDERRQRLYLKDIDCPFEWHEHLRRVIPPCLFYMNSNVEEKANALSRRKTSNGFDMFGNFQEQTPAIAGDLMSSLPEEMRAQNLMCYIGHEGTYTPAHKEMCASLGQNLMVEASGVEDGEKPGSSIWFMTESKDREVIREYFLSMLGHDIEIEKHFAQINAWKKANFPVYIVEQKVGDFILIPPLAPHQVWNRGTRTMKVAWNRTTTQTLKLALQEALPKSRLVCRDEQYKNKAIIYYTLKKYYKDLNDMEEITNSGWLGLGQDLVQKSNRMKDMAQDFKALFELYTAILMDEMFSFRERDVEFVPFDSNITCSYCRANIFNRFLTCKHCIRKLINGDEDTYDVCMECYAMGRSCICTSDLQWCEQFSWLQLVEEHERWRQLIIKNDGFVDIVHSPQPLELSRRLSCKKSIAQICQEQLRRRPFKDITKMEEEAEAESSEPDVDDEGRAKKRKKRRNNKIKKGETGRCHVCCHREFLYKLQYCTNAGCTEAYCYGVLYRAFDMMPQAVMENEKWSCPKCEGICNCASCRRSGQTQPYEPKSTLLGHDTRPIADDRSIEALVDFRVHNLSWLKVVGEESRNKNSKRMQRLQAQAQAEKAKDDNTRLEDAIGDDEAMTADAVAALQQAIAAEADNGSGEPIPADGEGADVSIIDNDDSTYPDPNNIVGRERMLGLGYYQQDESADKILFDPYQAPTAEALEEPQVSEYIKKTLRAAKRKARLEADDDPEYQGPRNKRKKNTPADSLQHVDPALFEEDAMAVDTTASPHISPIKPASGNELDSLTANRPHLRNAQPIASYIEPEEPIVEEFEDAVVTDPLALLNQFDNITVNGGDEQNPLDLASNAIKAMASKELEKPKMKRPRLPPDPNRPRWQPAVPAEPPRPKHRATRASLLAEGLTEEEATERLKELHPEPEKTPSMQRTNKNMDGLEINFDLYSERYSDSEVSVQTDDNNDKSFRGPYVRRPDGQPARRGRRPKYLFNPRPVQEPALLGVKRRPGRPPKNRASTGSVPLPVSSSESPLVKSLTMAERMAMRGKKFKIGQRRGPGRPPRKSAPADSFTAVNTARIRSTRYEQKSKDFTATARGTSHNFSSIPGTVTTLEGPESKTVPIHPTSPEHESEPVIPSREIGVNDLTSASRELMYQDKLSRSPLPVHNSPSPPPTAERDFNSETNRSNDSHLDNFAPLSSVKSGNVANGPPVDSPNVLDHDQTPTPPLPSPSPPHRLSSPAHNSSTIVSIGIDHNDEYYYPEPDASHSVSRSGSPMDWQNRASSEASRSRSSVNSEDLKSGESYSDDSDADIAGDEDNDDHDDVRSNHALLAKRGRGVGKSRGVGRGRGGGRGRGTEKDYGPGRSRRGPGRPPKRKFGSNVMTRSESRGRGGRGGRGRGRPRGRGRS